MAMVDFCLQGDTFLKEVSELALYVTNFDVQVHEFRAGITGIPSGKGARKRIVIVRQFVRVLSLVDVYGMRMFVSYE